MSDDRYLTRMIRYCEKITQYMEPITSYDQFIMKEEKMDAVALNLEQIGETAKKLSQDLKDNHPDIDWIAIIGLRNQISHEYEGLLYDIIYDVVMDDIPILKVKLTQVFALVLSSK